ncbi:MAG: flagellar assembly protein FliH [Sulfuriflexus sp.]|nr:flagellar assembly protein FliH [Sulfuriflexus sp.]
MSSSPKPTIINSDDGSEYAAWQPPSVQVPTAKEISDQEQQRLITADSIEVLQKQAYEEGYSQGFEKGVQDGAALVKERIQRLDTIVNFLQKPLADIDESVTEQLTQLSISIAKMLIRRELKTDPGQVVAVVKETVSALPAGMQNICVLMNPEDAELLRETMSLAEGESPWKIIEDPLLSRGGCKVTTDYSEVDASVEARLTAIIARMFGGERRSDSSTEE